jgi:hypothetical protein
MLRRFLVLGISSAALCSCYTDISVRPLSGKGGLTYSLPTVNLLITPAGDGSATYQWVYLPDNNAQYEVNAYSLIAKYTLDVQVENGLLKQVGGTQDTTDVAAQAVKTAAAIAAAQSASTSKGTPGGGGTGGGGTGGGGTGGGTTGGGGTSPQSTGDIAAAWGPVLLRVVADGSGVKFVPVQFPKLDSQPPSPQQTFQTNVLVPTTK